MALIACPDCGGQVSTAAPACPHCGRPIATGPVSTVARAKARAQHATLAGALLLGGSLLSMLGAVLPWATVTSPLVGTMSVSGMKGDGVLVLVGGVLLLLFALQAFASGYIWQIPALLLVLALGLVIGVDWVGVEDWAKEAPSAGGLVHADHGIGFLAMGLGAVLAFIGVGLGGAKPLKRGDLQRLAQPSVAPPSRSAPKSPAGGWRWWWLWSPTLQDPMLVEIVDGRVRAGGRTIGLLQEMTNDPRLRWKKADTPLGPPPQGNASSSARPGPSES